MSILQKLYDSEINFQISTFWDGGFDVKLGDSMNGFREEGSVDNFADAEQWLKDKALINYPESQFAKDVSIAEGIWHSIENAPEEVKVMAGVINRENRLGRLRYEFGVSNVIYVFHCGPSITNHKVDKYLILPNAD